MEASLSHSDPPRISIVTANYNGAAHLERAIHSVLSQGYPNLEYIVIDGGSTDRSRAIIESYADRLAYWESVPDRGFAHAYNKGFGRATGEIQAYLNADDVYCPWAFDIVSRCFRDVRELEWLTSLFPMIHGVDADFVAAEKVRPFNRELFHAGRYGADWFWIQQESTFWRRSLWDRAGGFLDESLSLAIDAELWARFFDNSELYAVATPLAGFRKRPDSKTGSGMEGYRREFERVLRRARDRGSAETGARRRVSDLLRRVGARSYTGKTVHYSHVKRRFVARTTRIPLR
ncbi:MAG TPA: glycosyltransferase family 2 protein [Gemmatimonadota bacterium]|nr:glycosyltransferase family 2 protein [Gemmatimonadota bacterium]